MSGPTAAQNQLQGEQLAFYQQAQNEATTNYEEDQALLQKMQGVFDPILAAGPSQKGFSAGEEETLDSQAVEGTAENYEGAAKAVGEKEAALGGGTDPLPTGAQEEERADVADSAAKAESGEETQIQEADYEQGNQNFKDATSALEDVSGQLNPAAYEEAATGAGSAAGTTADTIAKEQNSWKNSLLGAAGSIGSAAVNDIPWGDIGGGIEDGADDVGDYIDDIDPMDAAG